MLFELRVLCVHCGLRMTHGFVEMLERFFRALLLVGFLLFDSRMQVAANCFGARDRGADV